MTDVKTAINQMSNGELDKMRETFNNLLTAKAVDKLEEKKLDIAKGYFAQVNEGVEPLDELSNKTLTSYSDKAKKDILKGDGSSARYATASPKVKNRLDGLSKAAIRKSSRKFGWYKG
jgi:hypothetical protein